MLAALPCTLVAIANASVIGQGSPIDSASMLESWRASHGANWDMRVDPETHHLEMLFGGKVPAPTPPHTDADFIGRARDILAACQPMHGIDAETLILDRVKFLPLAQIGSSDKIAVCFHEEIAGVPVAKATVNVLLGTDGTLLAVQSTGLPHLMGFPTTPTLTAEEARARAVELFTAQFGSPPNAVGTAKLVVDQVRGTSGERTPELAWLVGVQRTSDDSPPEGRSYSIDALDGSMLAEETTTHFAPDVYGIVQAKATPGVLPDVAGNPPTAQLMKHLFVTSSAGVVTTDENGVFSFPSIDTPLECTFTFEGDYAHSGYWGINASCNDANHYELSLTLSPNQGNDVVMNDVPDEGTTAQANAY